MWCRVVEPMWIPNADSGASSFQCRGRRMRVTTISLYELMRSPVAFSTQVSMRNWPRACRGKTSYLMLPVERKFSARAVSGRFFSSPYKVMTLDLRMGEPAALKGRALHVTAYVISAGSSVNWMRGVAVSDLGRHRETSQG